MMELNCRHRAIGFASSAMMMLGVFISSFSSNVHAEEKIGHSACCGRQDVILIRGGLGYWPGAEALADDFSSAGYVPKIIHGWQCHGIAKRIARASQEGRMAGGVVIVGYSSGGDAACLLASELEKFGVRVTTMILIDPTLGLKVPANVDCCVNYYISRKFDAIPIFRGVPVEAACPDTFVFNIDLKGHPDFADAFRQNHFVFASTTSMRDNTLQTVASRQPAAVGSLAATASGSLAAPAPTAPIVLAPAQIPNITNRIVSNVGTTFPIAPN